MAQFFESTFNNITIKLDGNRYQGCIFTNCVLIYSGEDEVSLVSCTFINCQWQLNGAAAKTASFLRALYNGFGSYGKQMIESLLSQGFIQSTPSPAEEDAVKIGIKNESEN